MKTMNFWKAKALKLNFTIFVYIINIFNTFPILILIVQIQKLYLKCARIKKRTLLILYGRQMDVKTTLCAYYKKW